MLWLLPFVGLLATSSSLPVPSTKDDGIPCHEHRSSDSKISKVFSYLGDIQVNETDFARVSKADDDWIPTTESCFVPLSAVVSAGSDSMPVEPKLESRQLNYPIRWVIGRILGNNGPSKELLSKSNTRVGELSKKLDDLEGELNNLERSLNRAKLKDEYQKLQRDKHAKEVEAGCVGFYHELYENYRASTARSVTQFVSGDPTKKENLNILQNQFAELKKTDFKKEGNAATKDFNEFYRTFVDPLVKDCKESKVFGDELKRIFPPN